MIAETHSPGLADGFLALPPRSRIGLMFVIASWGAAGFTKPMGFVLYII